MKSTEFLLEYDHDRPIESIAQEILANCGKYVEEFASVGYDMRRYKLFRGSRHNISKILQQFAVEQNRRPRDTKSMIHQYADDWFLTNFGVRYRSGGVFAVGSSIIASEFGHPFTFLPIGEYTYTWSKIANDMTEYLHPDKILATVSGHNADGEFHPEVEGYIPYPRRDSAFNMLPKDDIREYINTTLGDANYQRNTGLLEEIYNYPRSEVMFSCKGYYLFNNSKSTWPLVVEEIKRLKGVV